MKRWILVGLIAIAVVVLVFLSSTVLFLAEDETEGSIPGVDMAAVWQIPEGFQWIYPGSSKSANGHTLHNIHMEDGDPYQYAKQIMEYTYNISPNICVVINNDAAESMFGDDIVGNIREHDWGEGNPRGEAIEMSMDKFNIFGAIMSLIKGDIKIFLI
ncbi:hypothetical protein [Methanobrevibacter sp. DSM 116169]|uniref:hypothetical protein n=1 Tax=Methanobrevibacter sp. DSM 116169 TaxID=3242727 RepID=UPI0038FCA79A